MTTAEDGSDGVGRTVREMMWLGKGQVNVYDVHWTHKHIGNGYADDHAVIIDLAGVKSLLYQVDTLPITAPWAGSVDVHVLCSVDGLKWDTAVLQTLVAAQAVDIVATVVGTLGAYLVKLQLDVNGVDMAAADVVQVLVRAVHGM